MTPITDRLSAEVGELIEVHGHRQGEAPRSGEILEVLGAPDHVHYRVRWEDGHESVYYPAGDATVRHERRPPSGGNVDKT